MTFLVDVFLPLALGICAAAVAFFGFRRTGQRAKATTQESLSPALQQAEKNDMRNEVNAEIGRLVAVARTMDDPMVVLDKQGRIMHINESAARLMNSPPDVLRGRPFQPKVMTRRILGTLSKDMSVMAEEALETATGVVWIEWYEQPLSLAKGSPPTEQLRVGRDITQRHALESQITEARARAEAANEAKSRFLATVSHEIRTPLSGVLGMADLLIDTGLTPEQRTYANAIGTSGKALLSLIDDILDFSKIEAGHLDLSQAPYDLEQLMESTVELLAPRAQDKGIEIASLVVPGTPCRLLGDAARLRQVLLNLAGNAVKFTDRGGVGIRAEKTGAEWLTLTVTDTGVGIIPEARARIFDDFVQADDSAARRHAGTGLGLAISKRLVERMGGTIAVDSELGKGSVFTIKLPLSLSGEAESRRMDLRAQRMLLCGPSAFEIPFTCQRLQGAGAEVLRAETVQTARLTLQQAGAFDAVFIDAAMGAENSQELIALAKAHGAKRLLVLVSPFERRDLGAPEHLGFDAFLVKPVRQASLSAYIAPHRAQTREPQPSQADTRTQSIAPLRILLAEDEDVNALMATTLLMRQGHEVIRAHDGMQAVGAYLRGQEGKETPFDLILMDMRMPTMDGMAATRKIRAHEHEKGLHHIPIFALTANAFADDRKACLAAGMDGFLTKPLDRDRLFETLDHVARQKEVKAS